MTVLGHPRDGEDEEEPAQEIMEVRAVSRTERGVSCKPNEESVLRRNEQPSVSNAAARMSKMRTKR